MSRVRCETCGNPVTPEEMAFCETCERFFDHQCLAEHACAVSAVRELSLRQPNFQIQASLVGRSYKIQQH